MLLLQASKSYLYEKKKNFNWYPGHSQIVKVKKRRHIVKILIINPITPNVVKSKKSIHRGIVWNT